MKAILNILACLLLLLAETYRVSSVETNGDWIYLYDGSGKWYKTLSISNFGEISGVSSDIVADRDGN